MALGQEDPSKTEKATQKRRREARKKGQVPKSAEMGKVMTLLGGVIAFRLLIEFYDARLSNVYRHFFKASMETEITKETANQLFLWGIQEMAIMVLPIMLAVLAVAYLTLRLQVGKLWTTEVFHPKWGQMFNLIKGVKKLMISPEAGVRLGKSILQAVAVGVAPVIVIRQEYPRLPTLFGMETRDIAAYILSVGYKMACYALVPMLIIGIIDLIYSRWSYEEKLKMTKDEVKDERKQIEGDPKIKAEQQKKMMQMMAKRMMQEVPTADVVITNPVHLALALRYDVMEAPAPLVVAKGAGMVADRIKEIAHENNVPIREDKPLAQALYKQVEIGETIPEDLYQAVAAILAKLDKFRRQ